MCLFTLVLPTETQHTIHKMSFWIYFKLTINITGLTASSGRPGFNSNSNKFTNLNEEFKTFKNLNESVWMNSKGSWC